MKTKCHRLGDKQWTCPPSECNCHCNCLAEKVDTLTQQLNSAREMEQHWRDLHGKNR